MNEEEFPKSSRTSQRAYIRFLNLSPRRVEVIWSNFDGIGVPYSELEPRQHIDIDTFFQHYWIVLDCETRDRMSIFYGPSRYPKTLFTPIKPERLEDYKRKFVLITEPIFSLKKLCFQKLRSLRVGRDRLNSVDLPTFLKDEYSDFLNNPNKLRLYMQAKQNAS